MPAAAIQVVPAGARHIGANVYQLPRRRSGGGVGKHRKHAFARKRSKHGFFARQWVWYAVALALADALGTVIMAEVGPWISVPALFLFAYGTVKKNRGAINAAYAIQGAHLLVYWGFSDIVRSAWAKMRGGGG